MLPYYSKIEFWSNEENTQRWDPKGYMTISTCNNTNHTSLSNCQFSATYSFLFGRPQFGILFVFKGRDTKTRQRLVITSLCRWVPKSDTNFIYFLKIRNLFYLDYSAMLMKSEENSSGKNVIKYFSYSISKIINKCFSIEVRHCTLYLNLPVNYQLFLMWCINISWP